MSVNALAWYYVPDLDPASGTAVIAHEEWHHAHHVMRLKPGDSLIAFDGNGRCYEAVLELAQKAAGQIILVRDVSKSFSINNPFAITAAFAPTKNIDRVEYAVEKLTEIGVSQIVFLECEHGERTHIRMDRMHKIIVSAAKQSRKIWLPTLHDLITPAEYLSEIQQSATPVKIYCCHLDESAEPVYKNYSPSASVILLVGPEGGFSNQEVEIMKSAGAKIITLGPHRLRAETAAIVAAAQVSMLGAMQ
jgi:16S rRNA (uracil1498-N3)-methyltransferase